MYAYIQGEDEHLCYKWFSKRSDAEYWLENQKILYGICYNNPDTKVVSNKEFREIFGDEIYRGKIEWRRLGNRLRKLLKEHVNIK